jgi:hypothetical protein
MGKLRVALVVLGMARCALGQPVADDFLIERHRAGPVEIGADAYDLYEWFPIEGRKLVDLHLEAMLSPALALSVPGSSVSDGLIAELAPRDNELVVFRIGISDPRFQTEAGIGVGSTVSELRSACSLDEVSTGEGAVYIVVNELAAAFALDQSGPSGPDLWGIRDLQQIPGEVVILRILLTQ